MSSAGAPRVVEVGDGIFAYVQPDGSWYLNNTGFLAGRRGVICVDASSTEARTRALLEAVRRVSDRPVRTLVNTHHHGDHTYGNYLFGGATIVGHERTREGVLAQGPPGGLPYWTPVEWGDVEVEPPFLTYTDGVTLYRDELRIECRYVGTPAHTTNDSMVWIPDQGVLFCGDLLFNGGTPFLLMGSIEGALAALEELRTYPARTIVPGHGPVVEGAACAELIDHTAGYLRFVQERAAEAHAAGLTPLDAGRETDLGAYADLLDAERIVGNLHRAYAEIADADADGPVDRGRPIDLAAALDDMVTYNGGQPLTCHA